MFYVIIRKLRSFVRQPTFIQAWFLPLWVILGLGKLAIFIVSFKKLAPLLGHHAGIHPFIPLASIDEESRGHLIGRAIRLAAKYTPWDSNCFPQAIAARLLLGLYKIPYALYFGLSRDATSSQVKAHAWVRSGKVRVSGGESFTEFVVVGIFTSKLIPIE